LIFDCSLDDATARYLGFPFILFRLWSEHIVVVVVVVLVVVVVVMVVVV